MEVKHPHNVITNERLGVASHDNQSAGHCVRVWGLTS